MPFHHSLDRHTRDEAYAIGKDMRTSVPRPAHADLADTERDVAAMVRRQHQGRIGHLIPLRVERMSESAFAFYRATADVMATDLAPLPVTGIEVVINGDAHLGNFGFYASPERRLLFDLNDFDESGIGPWEWDVKRLAASVVLAMREKEADIDAQRRIAGEVVEAYRNQMRSLAEESALNRYFTSLDADALMSVSKRAESDVIDKAVQKARRRTSEAIVRKLTHTNDDGELRITADPPIVVPHEGGVNDQVRQYFKEYLASLRTDTALLLSQFKLMDVAQRVVGVGSVGNLALIVLLQGPTGEPLVLQLKQSSPSVLETHGKLLDVVPEHGPGAGAGRNAFRVVASAHVLQAYSDPFLGWTEGFYWRQFRDMKGSIEVSELTAKGLERYGELCGRLLARAHSQSPAGAIIAGYLGKGDGFDRAVAEFSVKYADLAESDYQRFLDAAGAGEI